MSEYKSLVNKIPIPPEGKTKQKDYLKMGALAIVDQGQELIGGYTDNTEKTIRCELPVVVFGDHTRAVKYITFPFGAGADGIKVLQPKETVLPKFLYYGTQYLAAKMPSRGYARHYQFLEKMDLPVPPLAEQQHIVARIEELFSQLDSSVETLRKTKQQLAVYRQAVLKEAFEGRGICVRKIKDACIKEFAEVGTGATPLTTNKAYYGGNIPWITSGKISDGDIYNPTEYITELAINETNCKIYPAHTLLVAMYGEGKTRGKCAELMIPAATNQALAAIVLDENAIVKKSFLKWFLAFNYENIRLKAVGGVQPNINLNIVKNIAVPIFSKHDQIRIVEEIESRLSVCDSIEQTVDAALQQAEALRQSILKQAFEKESI